MAKQSIKLREIKRLFDENGITMIENIDTNSLCELKEVFEGLEDKRFQPYVEYYLSDIVVICILAMLSNCNEWVEIADFAQTKEVWLKSFLGLEKGVPSHDTIQRVMSMVDNHSLLKLTVQFFIEKIDKLSKIRESINENEETTRDIISIDGKTSIGSKRNKTDKEAVKAMHTVSAFSHEYGMCVSQKTVLEKSNEIPAVQDLIEITDIKDCIVTWDALNTQKETVKKVIEKKGDYIGALKANHHSFYTDVKDYFEEDVLQSMRNNKRCFFSITEKEHSALITREYYLSNEIEWLFNKSEWAGLKSIGCVVKTIEKLNGTKEVEKRYYISSITEINYFEKGVRTHWNVENKLHWHLDFTFKEDKNTTMQKNGAKNLQILRKIVLSILNIVKPNYNKSLKRIRFALSLNFEKYIEDLFKLLNTDAIEEFLIKTGKIK